jgi:hypothetical protein
VLPTTLNACHDQLSTRRETAPQVIVRPDVTLVRNEGFTFDTYTHEYAYSVRNRA